LAVVRDLREARTPAGPEELAEFETDVLAGFVLARATAGLPDATTSHFFIQDHVKVAFALTGPQSRLPQQLGTISPGPDCVGHCGVGPARRADGDTPVIMQQLRHPVIAGELTGQHTATGLAAPQVSGATPRVWRVVDDAAARKAVRLPGLADIGHEGQPSTRRRIRGCRGCPH
jgi:hypothetical protein